MLLISSFFNFCTWLLHFIPVASSALGSYSDSFLNLVGYGIYFFGENSFLLCFTNIMLWATIDLIWVIVEWCYKKIPGVN